MFIKTLLGIGSDQQLFIFTNYIWRYFNVLSLQKK